MQQVLFVLGEVLRAHVLDLRQLLVVFILHFFAMRLRSLVDAADEILEFVNLVQEFLPKRIVSQINLLLHIVLIVLDQFVNCFYMLDSPFLILLCLLAQFLVCEIDLIEELGLRICHFCADFVDDIRLFGDRFFVILDCIFLSKEVLVVAAQFHFLITHRPIISALNRRELFFEFRDAARNFFIHCVSLKLHLLINFVKPDSVAVDVHELFLGDAHTVI